MDTYIHTLCIDLISVLYVLHVSLLQTTPNYIAVATSRGIVELDTSDAWQSSVAYTEDIALSAKAE